MYTLTREQLVETSLEAAWDFLRNPVNLNAITPDDLHFRIISPLPEVMFNGLLIQYKVTIPVIGARNWVAEIKHIREYHSFVDEQRLGPYRFWYHYHEITETGHGIKLVDKVHYGLPYGPLGQALHCLFVKKTLNRIFDYRASRLAVVLKP